MRACADTTAEGTLWPVDANLRPEGQRRRARAHARQYDGYYRAVGGRPGSSRRC